MARIPLEFFSAQLHCVASFVVDDAGLHAVVLILAQFLLPAGRDAAGPEWRSLAWVQRLGGGTSRTGMGVARSSGMTRLCDAPGGGKYPSRGIIGIERNNGWTRTFGAASAWLDVLVSLLVRHRFASELCI